MQGRPWAFIFFILVCTSFVRAEIRSEDSLELMVANADVVARGHVVKIVQPNPPPFGRGYFEFHVDEQFKGPRTDTITVEIDGWGANETAQMLMHDGAEAMIFQIDSTRLMPRDSTDVYQGELERRALRLVPLLANPETDRTRKHLSQMVTMDFRLLDTGPQITDAVREAAKFPTTRPMRWVYIPALPSSPAFRALFAGSVVTIAMPVDPRLEALGQKWFAQRNTPEAIAVLQLFPSAANAEIFKQLLHDPGWATTGGGRLSHVYHNNRLYAARVLESWGQTPETPAVVLPDDLYRPLRGSLLAPIILLIMLLAWLARRIGRRIAPRVPVLALLLISSLTALWVTSRRTVPELYWNGDETQIWLSSCRGSVQFTWITNCPWRLMGQYNPFIPLQAVIEPGVHDRFWHPSRDLVENQRPAQGLMYGLLPPEPLASLWLQSPMNVSAKYLLANNGLLEGTQTETFLQQAKPASVTVRFHRLQLHISALMTLAAIPLLVAANRLRVRHRRHKHNLCVQCGYDLRGSSARCPECGAALASAEHTSLQPNQASP